MQSQADTEQADLARERQELLANPAGELEELTSIYVERGLSRQVAEQLSLHDALAAHARDELGITEALRARPIQAALASSGSFCLGALFPVLMILLSPAGQIARVTAVMALLVLTALGGLAAYVGGAPVGRGAGRMLLWGALALGLTALAGRLFGAVV